MNRDSGTLLCWHAERAGIEVLEHAIKALRNRRIEIGNVLYVVQAGRQRTIPSRVEGARIDLIEILLDDPTHHGAIYEQVRLFVLPRLKQVEGTLHINVSPGTPAMHSVWLVLHAGGALPEGTQLWSSQVSKETKRARIDPVDFPITTYLSEIHRYGRLESGLAVYEPEAQSEVRREAFERLARYARVIGAPLLILGERGTGKTRLVETIVATLKGRKKVVTLPCGGLDSSLAESLLFGHRKGAFTGAATDRPGLLAEADGGILFLDEVQDLPKAAQRKLVRVFQDRQRRYRPIGSDRELCADIELVCASNLSIEELRGRLDADLFDRLSHLTVTVPSLRECRKDVRDDWGRVWRELRQREDLPEEAPWFADLEKALEHHALPGNLRDLQRLAVLCMAWWSKPDPRTGMRDALKEWARWSVVPEIEGAGFGDGSRTDRIHWFRTRLAQWAKQQHGTWASASKALACDEKTLRQDAGHVEVDAVGLVPSGAGERPSKRETGTKRAHKRRAP